MSTNAIFKIKRSYIVGLASWLSGQSLSGKASRSRTKFVTELIGYIEEAEKVRKDMLSKFAKLEKGEPKMNKEKTGYILKEGGEESFLKEYQDYMNEDIMIDILESRKEDVRIIKDIVLNTEYKFGPTSEDKGQEIQAKIRQASDYNEWCVALEEVDL